MIYIAECKNYNFTYENMFSLIKLFDIILLSDEEYEIYESFLRKDG